MASIGAIQPGGSNIGALQNGSSTPVYTQLTLGIPFTIQWSAYSFIPATIKIYYSLNGGERVLIDGAVPNNYETSNSYEYIPVGFTEGDLIRFILVDDTVEPEEAVQTQQYEIVAAGESVLTTITVTPNPANVTVGDTQQFTAVGYDQYGVLIDPQPTFNWSVVNS